MIRYFAASGRPAAASLVAASLSTLLITAPRPAVAAGDGLHPSGAVICEGGTLGYGTGTLYGLTYTGGAHNLGAIWKETAGNPNWVESVLYSFSGTADGANPVGALAGPPNTGASPVTLYGVTSNGGSGGKGTVFQITTAGVFRSLHAFTGTDGANPTSVIWDGGSMLYGTCANGGASSKGTVFSYSLTTSQFTVLHSFTGGTDGANPNAPLFLGNSVLYGTAANGGSGYGTVFRIATAGGTLSTLHSFSSTDGANPACQLLLEPGTSMLLGTTANGGGWNTGTIFQINENGTGFQSLASFEPAGTNNASGQNPSGGLVYDSYTAKYWGVTSASGAGAGGVLYSYQIGQMLTGAVVAFTTNPANSFYPMGNTPVGPPTIVPTITNGPEFYLVSNYYGGMSNGVNLNDGVLFEWIGSQPNFLHTFGP